MAVAQHIHDRTAECIALALDLSAARDPSWRDELALELLQTLRALQLDLDGTEPNAE